LNMIKKAKQVDSESRTVGNNSVRYKDVKCDPDGWASCSDFSPFPYDLVECRLSKEDQTKMGWFDGSSFVGLRLTPKDEVVEWRRTFGHEQESNF